LAERTDYKVKAVLDRDKLIEDINGLLSILRRQRVFCVVSAVSDEDAAKQAIQHFQNRVKIPFKYFKDLHTRRMPT